MATGAMMWYEDKDVFDKDMEDEDPGSDFLAEQDVTDEDLKKEDVKAQVSNMTGCLGAKREKNKKGEAARQRNLNSWIESVSLASKLTKLPKEACGLPVDVNTIRACRLENKDFKLPPYKNNDNGLLMKHHIDIFEKNYKTFCTLDEVRFYELNPEGNYLPQTDFDDIEPLVSDMCRFCIKYWHLHPWLSRQNAYLDAVEHLKKHYKWDNTPKHIIDGLLAERVDTIIKKQLFSLKLVPKDGTSTEELVFVENEDAALVIGKFLKIENWKCKKEHLDIVLDLQDCIANVVDPGEKTEWNNKFGKVVPKETAAYLEKLNKQKEAAAKAEEKEKAKAAAEAEKQEKKRKALDELAAAPSKTSSRSASRSEPKEVRALKALAAADPFWDFKLKVHVHETVDRDPATTGSVRAAKKQSKEQKIQGIHKTVVNVITTGAGAGKSEVRYTKPGVEWSSSFGWRYNLVINAMGMFGATDKGSLIVEACVEGKENLTITKEAARVVMATMLHTRANSDKDCDELGVQTRFHEPTFIGDLKITKSLWCPPALGGSIITIHGFYVLACGEGEIGGAGKELRIKLLLDYFTEKESPEKAKLVETIIQILQHIDQEIEGAVEAGKQELAIDPFDTESNIGKAAEIVV